MKKDRFQSICFSFVCLLLINFASCGGDDSGDSLASDDSTYSSDYVDLGLSVMWATCNVGASSPEESGNYYAWAEKSTKSSYEEDNSSSYEVYRSDISGSSSYDVAKAKLGGSYRTPTETEMQELIDHCTWTYTSLNGTSGYNITGPSGNSIFLPITGYYDYSEIYDDAYGYYWTSSPYSTDSYDSEVWKYSKMLTFSSKVKSVSSLERWKGLCVRPVYGEQNTDFWGLSYATGYINGYAYVDLGLSVKWALTNMGATNYYDYGDYYAWGETSPKDYFDESTSLTYGLDLDDISGDPTYDAAAANWGDTWRMPTKAEFQELMKLGHPSATTNGISGRLITGSNGNALFLPMEEGYMNGNSIVTLSGEEIIATYWTSTPWSSHSAYIYMLYKGTYAGMARWCGLFIRPVSD